jgi:hypothetical protein
MKYVFMCDLMASIIICQGDIYNTYCDQTSKFIATFWVFKSSLKLKQENIQI